MLKPMGKILTDSYTSGIVRGCEKTKCGGSFNGSYKQCFIEYMIFRTEWNYELQLTGSSVEGFLLISL